MADVLAIAVILTALGLAYPALIGALRLFFPERIERIHARLEARPVRCFWIGLGLGLLVGIPAALLAASPAGFFKFIGWALISLSLGASALGAAALAQILDGRLLAAGRSPAPSWMRGAVLIELAAAFPIIGWFLVFPISTLAAFGAALPVLLGRMEKSTASAGPETAPLSAARS
jgi:hypothetical protein